MTTKLDLKRNNLTKKILNLKLSVRWKVSLLSCFFDNKLRFSSLLKNWKPNILRILAKNLFGNQCNKRSFVWNSIGWNLLGVVNTMYFFDNLIIFWIIFLWLSKLPTCSITAEEITKSDLKDFNSLSPRSSVIDFTSVESKSPEEIFWFDNDFFFYRDVIDNIVWTFKWRIFGCPNI